MLDWGSFVCFDFLFLRGTKHSKASNEFFGKSSSSMRLPVIFVLLSSLAIAACLASNGNALLRYKATSNPSSFFNPLGHHGHLLPHKKEKPHRCDTELHAHWELLGEVYLFYRDHGHSSEVLFEQQGAFR